jgi:hypothetical protein
VSEAERSRVKMPLLLAAAELFVAEVARVTAVVAVHNATGPADEALVLKVMNYVMLHPRGPGYQITQALDVIVLGAPLKDMSVVPVLTRVLRAYKKHKERVEDGRTEEEVQGMLMADYCLGHAQNEPSPAGPLTCACGVCQDVESMDLLLCSNINPDSYANPVTRNVLETLRGLNQDHLRSSDPHE